MGAISELKEKLITGCRILDLEGIMGELGHFGVRCPEKGGILMNGRVSPGQAREEDIILLDMEGKKLEGELEPASECPLHLAVYQKRPDVMAVAHTHSPMVVTLSIAGVQLRTVENQGASIIGSGARPGSGRIHFRCEWSLFCSLCHRCNSQPDIRTFCRSHPENTKRWNARKWDQSLTGYGSKRDEGNAALRCFDIAQHRP